MTGPVGAADPVAVLRELCAGTAARLADPLLRERLGAIGAGLAAPLQVAVGGAVSGGKSTLVNALLGRPVAAVDAGECTRVVTWYEHGPAGAPAQVECVDGEIRELAAGPDGRLPRRLGVQMDRVLRVRVPLPLPALERLTVIDTPGINTVSVENEAVARRMLFGTDATDHAQALIYVLRYVQRFDAGALADFRGLTAACGMTGVNTLAVLSQVDRRGDEDDPWPSARRLAARAYEQLRASVFDVVPVIGLLAETARCGSLTGADVAVLRELGALDPFDLEDELLDLDGFATSARPPGPADVRRGLVGKLHRYGINLLASALREDPELPAGALNELLLRGSGFGGASTPDAGAPGTGGLDGGGLDTGTVAAGVAHFARRAGQLKALAAVTRLRGLARTAGQGGDHAVLAALADTLDEGRPIVAGLHGLRVLSAVEAVGRGQLTLNEEMLTDLVRLHRGEDPRSQLGLAADAGPDEAAQAARSASMRWRTVAVTMGGRVAGQRARDVLAVYEELAAAPRTPCSFGETAPTTAGVAAVSPKLPRPPVPVDRVAVAAVRDSPVVPPEDRAALEHLLAGASPHGQLGLPDEAGARERAAELGARFRILMRRPLPLAQRRAVTTVCDTYEAIWTALSVNGDS